VRAARRGDLVSHRRAMRHVVGQMSVAVTSRAMLLGFDAVGFDPDLAYVIALWVPVIGSALVVEIASLRSRPSVRSAMQVIERSRREFYPLALLVRVCSPLARPFVRLGR